jgi:ABC-type transport system involved in cytochrome c biogenesis permease subunit
MATDQITPPKSRPAPAGDRAPERVVVPRVEQPLWKRVLAPLASLKLTVVLMALAVFIVLAGTFAQTRVDIWDAIRQYFRIDLAKAFNGSFPFIHPSELFVWIDLKLFFPPSFFPADPAFPQGLGWLASIWPTQGAIQQIPDSVGIWFPRGWTIGVVMVANLLAAHLVRFKLQADGVRLWSGLGLIGLGLLVTYAVVMSHDEGLATESWFSYASIWRVLQFSLFAVAAPCIYGSVASTTEKWGLRTLLAGVAALLCLGGAFTLWTGPIADESMRILYQLIKGLLSATVLLTGCLLVFRKRAGIVLLHGGVGLLMAYEVLVGTQHVESQMVIPEGAATNFAYDSRARELAIVDASNPSEERHIVIAEALLKTGETIKDPRLPFDIKVVEWIPNGVPERLKPGEKTIATQGLGKVQRIVPLEKSIGTESKTDFPAAYVQLQRRDGDATSRDLGTYMLTTATDPALHLLPFVEKVRLSPDKSFDLSLRFVRYYKDYQVELLDVQKNDYAGTTHARDWRSVVNRFRPDGTKELDRYEIWMNNPLRLGGETFYQQEWRQTSAGEVTTLQVVQNEGWMAPYVACMIVAVGMFYQFGVGLLRFVDRRQRHADPEVIAYELNHPAEDDTTSPFLTRHAWLKWGVPAGVAALVTLALVGYAARQRKIVKDEFNLSAFADLPVVMGGRSLPLESLAMNRLMQISDLQSFKEKDPDPTDREKPASQPASKWLLDMIARPKLADAYPVFRIENDTIARSLGLEISENRRYAYQDFEKKLPELQKQMSGLAEKPRKQWTVEERKRQELLSNVSDYREVRDWFGDLEPQIRKDFPELYSSNFSQMQRATQVLDMVRRLDMLAEESKEFQVPLVIPMHMGEAPDSIVRFKKIERLWEPFPVATGFAALDDALGKQAPPAPGKFRAILTAWKDQKPMDFNTAVAAYRTLLVDAAPEQLEVGTTHINLAKSDFEGYFNRIGAFNLLSFAYLVVLVLTLAGWGAAGFGALDGSRLLQRTAMWTAVALLVMHTLGIIGRIYISGRPPVTNLYSSAIFIGWAAVLLGVIFERVFHLGVGNAVAALSGFATLRIAHALMGDGDTLAVLEPVLDTQFWLATHVVCITLGYAATYVAGLFGLMYVLRGSRAGLLAFGLMGIVGGGLAGASGEREVATIGGAFVLGGLLSLALGLREFRSGAQPVSNDIQKVIARMIYGMLCGATFLSFVGTVLGGLWADDSWGRFWGWDPKENGALIIVMWNALILHARWDGMVRERGMAALAILGNIVTSWSWWGVNELGIGKHTYGFTEGRLFWLLIFCLSQLAIFAIALLPRTAWWGEGRAAA